MPCRFCMLDGGGFGMQRDGRADVTASRRNTSLVYQSTLSKVKNNPPTIEATKYPPGKRLIFTPNLRLDTGGAGINKVPVFEPRRGENSIAVGKGTLFVPAAHGGRSLDLPTLKGSHRCGLSRGGGSAAPTDAQPPDLRPLQGRRRFCQLLRGRRAQKTCPCPRHSNGKVLHGGTACRPWVGGARRSILGLFRQLNNPLKAFLVLAGQWHHPLRPIPPFDVSR